MTFLVAIHAGSYVLLAADKMESARVAGQMLPTCCTASKIVDTPLGAVTGAGLVPLLDAVKAQLRTEGVSRTERMLSIIGAQRQRARNEWKVSEQDLMHTSWLLTYRTRKGDGAEVRCAGFVPSINDQQFVIIEPGKPWSVFPNDAPPMIVSHVTDRLRAGLRMADGTLDISTLPHHLTLVCWAMREVAESSKLVSTTFDFAVTMADGTWYSERSVDAASTAFDDKNQLERT